MNIIFIGSGNVAWHLSQKMKNLGHTIVQVYSKSEKNARLLGEHLQVPYTNDLISIKHNADLYVFAVTDNVLVRLASNKYLKTIIGDAIAVHTAGAVELSVLKTLSSRYGVFYPLQTFSKEKQIDFEKIPICVEAVEEQVLEELKYLAASMSKNVVFTTFEQRKYMHLAGVFACNFANHMYAVAEKIMHSQNLSFSILHPLIQETAQKVENNSPKNVQTGPVIRNDHLTINKHLELLNNEPELKKAYINICESMRKLHDIK